MNVNSISKKQLKSFMESNEVVINNYQKLLCFCFDIKYETYFVNS